MTINPENVEVRIIASPENWIEGSAIEQLKKTAELPNMKQAIGMPDLHPGKGNPIGAAFITKGVPCSPFPIPLIIIPRLTMMNSSHPLL